MLRIVVIISLLLFTSAIPFDFQTKPENDLVYGSAYNIKHKKPLEEVNEVDANATIIKNVVVGDCNETKDSHEKHENIFHIIFHHEHKSTNSHKVEETDDKNASIQQSNQSHKLGEKKQMNLFVKSVDVSLENVHHIVDESGDSNGSKSNFLEKVIQNTGTAIKSTGKAIDYSTNKFINNTGGAMKHTGEVIKDGTGKFVDKTREVLKKSGKVIHDGSLKIEEDAKIAMEKTGEGIKKTTIEVVEKGKRIIKGEDPIADLNVNSGIKILDNEVRLQGEVRIGFGHQTGAHGSASAHILDQEAHINADILNSPALDSSSTPH